MIASYYRRVLAVAAVLVFFTNLSVYVSLGEIAQVSPWHIILIFAAAAIPLLFSREYLTTLGRTPVAYWCYGFVLMSAVWLLFQGSPSETSWQEFRIRVLSSLFLLILLPIFAEPDAQIWARRAILAALFIAVSFDVYEMFHPLSFSIVAGRSAGLYVNSNQAGAALVLGLIFGAGVLPQRYRLLLALIVGAGVFLTVSRGAILGWLVSVVILIKTGEINLKRSLAIGGAVLVIVTFLLMTQWNSLQYQLMDLGVLNKDVAQRIEGFLDFRDFDADESAVRRKEIARGAWGMFSNSPIIGNGVAASLEGYCEVPSHNEYLSLMVDHGLGGFFILPLLVLSAAWRAKGQASRIAKAASFFLLFWGLFSHNVLTEHYILLTISLLAAMSKSSRVYHFEPERVGHLSPLFFRTEAGYVRYCGLSQSK
jgi:hypothetical protein